MRWLVLFGILAVLTASSVCAEEPADKVKVEPLVVKPLIVWTGTDSKQVKQSFTRCCSQEEWQAIWHTHRGRDKDTDRRTCPEIDFDSCTVIAIFHGKSESNSGIGVAAVVEEEYSLRLRYRPLWYQTVITRETTDADLKKLETQSFAFIVLRRTGKAIYVDEDMRSGCSDPPVWKERVRFKATGD